MEVTRLRDSRVGSVDADRGWRAATNLREGTLGEDTVGCLSAGRRGEAGWRGVLDLHEKTGLSAGTVTNNDQLAADLGHLRDWSMGDVVGSEGNARGRR